MNFLLKIVQGPNAGAEVALVEGLCVKLGRADSCDLILADPTLPEVACELDTSAERVMLFLPGGAQERLEPLHVRFFGATALAVGPADAPWGPLVWPPAPGSEAAPEAPEVAHEAQDGEPSGEEKKHLVRRFLFWALLVLLLLALFFCCYLYRAWIVDRGKATFAWLRAEQQRMMTSAEPIASTACALIIDEVASHYGLSFEARDDGITRVWGNLATRAERLQATAALYATEPGAEVLLSDDESLREAAEETLQMLTEGRVSVVQAGQRNLVLSGSVESTTAMRKLLQALHAEVPYLECVNCEQVVCGKREAGDGAEQALAAKAKSDKGPKTLPLCGIFTTPYPCLVLRDGSRVTEGAEFGGFVVDKIEADRIVIHNADGRFEWRP